MRALSSAALATLFLVAPGALAQDALRFGVPSGAGPFTVPILLADAAGTPLGVDRTAGSRIHAFAVTVRFTPAAAVASASLARAGLLAGRTPLFETTAEGDGTITWVGSFDESAGTIPFAQPPAGGDPILALSVTLAPGATVSASIDAATPDPVGGEIDVVVERQRDGLVDRQRQGAGAHRRLCEGRRCQGEARGGDENTLHDGIPHHDSARAAGWSASWRPRAKRRSLDASSKSE